MTKPSTQFRVYTTVREANGEAVCTQRQTYGSKAAATRAANWSKQFDGEHVRMGRAVERRIETVQPMASA